MIKKIAAADAQPGMVTPFGGYLWRIKEVITGPQAVLGVGLLVEGAGEAAGRFRGFVLDCRPGELVTVQVAA